MITDEGYLSVLEDKIAGLFKNFIHYVSKNQLYQLIIIWTLYIAMKFHKIYLYISTNLGLTT